jgi:RNA polymerase subunit RPABC4/transcription elongation factor Spt4
MVALRLKDIVARASALTGSQARAVTAARGVDDALARPGAGDAGRLRRERRRLLRARETAIRDLGGLALEMARRDRMNTDLLRRRANAILESEVRVHRVDAAIEAALAATPSPAIATLDVCECGALMPTDSTFCPSCGRTPQGAEPAGASCRSCGAALPAEARYCPACGVARATAGSEREPR